MALRSCRCFQIKEIQCREVWKVEASVGGSKVFNPRQKGCGRGSDAAPFRYQVFHFYPPSKVRRIGSMCQDPPPVSVGRRATRRLSMLKRQKTEGDKRCHEKQMCDAPRAVWSVGAMPSEVSSIRFVRVSSCRAANAVHRRPWGLSRRVARSIG